MTQCEKILKYMTDHGGITQREAIIELSCMRLASRIHDLKVMGHPIKTEMVCVTNGRGEKAHFACYSLEKASHES